MLCVEFCTEGFSGEFLHRRGKTRQRRCIRCRLMRGCVALLRRAARL
jgi:hypothetical protein